MDRWLEANLKTEGDKEKDQVERRPRSIELQVSRDHVRTGTPNPKARNTHRTDPI